MHHWKFAFKFAFWIWTLFLVIHSFALSFQWCLLHRHLTYTLHLQAAYVLWKDLEEQVKKCSLCTVFCLCLGGPMDQSGVLHDLCVFAYSLSRSLGYAGTKWVIMKSRISQCALVASKIPFLCSWFFLVHTKTYVTVVSDTSNFVFIKAELISTIYHICV